MSIVEISDGVSRQIESTTDELKYGGVEPKTMTCSDCRKKHRNPEA